MASNTDSSQPIPSYEPTHMTRVIDSFICKNDSVPNELTLQQNLSNNQVIDRSFRLCEFVNIWNAWIMGIKDWPPFIGT